jgi:hypothetical protein
MRRFFMGALLLLSSCIAAAAQSQNVAILVFSQSSVATQYARIAQTRLEQILNDNGINVLDRDKAEELKKGWTKLQDPGALITAEEFVKNASKYAISGVYRVYLDTGLTRGLANIFTATALADIRYISEEAQVRSATSPAMGVKGIPPSDGLTESAAISNAIQRSVDATAQQLGFKVLDITNPRLFNVRLQPTSSASYAGDTRPQAVPASDPGLKLAKLAEDDWLSEEITCAQKSPDQKMIAAGGYIRKTSLLGGRPQRVYGSSVHVLDLTANKEVLSFVTAPVAERTRYEKGGSKILDCMFVSSWRYLAAVTNSKLFLWDTERGTVMSEIVFDQALDQATLEFGRDGEKDYLSVVGGAGKIVYQIVRE